MNTTLHALLDRAADKWPHHPALIQSDTSRTFSQVQERSRQVARTLRERGIGRGDRVVVAVEDGLLTADWLFGISRAGAAFAILHTDVLGEPLRHVLNDCTPSVVVTDDSNKAATANAAGVPVLAPQSAHTTSPKPALTSDGAGDMVDVIPTDLAALIYTSGSTSLPKAVVCDHSAISFAAQAIHDALGYRHDDVVYCPLPLSFDYGLYQIFLGLLSGATVSLGRPAEVGPSLVRSLTESKATILAGVPAVSESLLRLLRRTSGQNSLPHLRLLTNTGAAMQQGVVDGLREELPGLHVQLMFGLTECKRATIMPPDADISKPGACGRALAGTRVLILDDDGNPLPRGQIGQIAVQGPHVMLGYWRRPELNEQRFPRRHGLQRELHTGDYGWLDDDGYLYFDGRRDDVYKERGFRVSATEVEAAAMRVSGVDSAAVLPPAGERQATLIAVTTLSRAELERELREQLEEYKMPSIIHFFDALPLNGNGKVDKRALVDKLSTASVRTQEQFEHASP